MSVLDFPEVAIWRHTAYEHLYYVVRNGETISATMPWADAAKLVIRELQTRLDAPPRGSS
jgi:hypothetical protein